MRRQVPGACRIVLSLLFTFLLGAPVFSQTGRDVRQRGRARAKREPAAPPPHSRATTPPRRSDYAGVTNAERRRRGEPHQGIERGGLRYPRRFDLRPQFYRDGYGYRFGVPAYDDLRADELERAYFQGVEEGRRLERAEVQAERGQSAHYDAMNAGRKAFASRQYGLAIRQFLLAATLDQGDPVARLEAAHAQVALGGFDPAVRLLRRAFELERRIVYLPMDLRSAYARVEDFHDHVKSVRRAALADAKNAEGWFLLGYYHYFSADMEEASAAFGKAVELRPRDPLYATLLELARLGARSPRPRE